MAEAAEPLIAPTVQPTTQPTVNLVSAVEAEIKKVFGSNAEMALCIAKHENGTHEPTKVNDKGNYPVGSRDRGIFQINSYWHPEVTDAMAFDWKINIQEAYRISENGTNWDQWATKKYCI